MSHPSTTGIFVSGLKVSKDTIRSRLQLLIQVSKVSKLTIYPFSETKRIKNGRVSSALTQLAKTPLTFGEVIVISITSGYILVNSLNVHRERLQNFAL